MTETHSEKQIMTYDDKEIDKLVGWARREALTSDSDILLGQLADALAQLKTDRAFLRTEVETLRAAPEKKQRKADYVVD